MIWPFADKNVGPSGLRLEAGGVYLRPPRMGDCAEWLELRRISAKDLTPYEPKWSDDALTKAAFMRRYRQQALNWRRGTAHSFFIFDKTYNQLLGGLNLFNIKKGVSLSADIGYYMHSRHTRKGHMSNAIGRLSDYAFDELALHRLQAACLPSNIASHKALLKAGFTKEGLAKSYLKIDGKWQDHIIFAQVML